MSTHAKATTGTDWKEGMNEAGAPAEVNSAVNLMAHPMAGAAAVTAIGFGWASQAFGMWAGVLTGMAEASQRALSPFADDPGPVSSFADRPGMKRPEARRLAAVPVTERVSPAPRQVAATGLMPEDFRRPRSMERPAAPDDLKAIAGIGPKLESVLNGLGIWTLGQIAGWTEEEVAWVDDMLGFKGRIGRDDWLGQAQRQASSRSH